MGWLSPPGHGCRNVWLFEIVIRHSCFVISNPLFPPCPSVKFLMSSHFQNIRAVLSGGAFARYMTGEAISMTGTWMQLMAQGWVMTTLTSSAAMLGMVNFATGILMIALTMIGGSFADRYDKRWILLVTQIVQIILALFIGTLVGQ